MHVVSCFVDVDYRLATLYAQNCNTQGQSTTGKLLAFIPLALHSGMYRPRQKCIESSKQWSQMSKHVDGDLIASQVCTFENVPAACQMEYCMPNGVLYGYICQYERNNKSRGRLPIWDWPIVSRANPAAKFMEDISPLFYSLWSKSSNKMLTLNNEN